MVSELTRGENIQDYFLTSNPTLVNDIEIHPGIADHDLVLINAHVKPYEGKQIPRSVPLYKKTNWEGFKSYISSSFDNILKKRDIKDVEEIWLSLKTVIDKGISQFVPIKKIGSKRSLPWITQHIKRLIRKRDSLFQKQKKGHPRDRHHFKEVKHHVQSKIRTAYNNYLQSVLGLSDEEGNIDKDSDKQKFAPKQLFSLIKNAKQDSHGVSPLKEKKTRVTHLFKIKIKLPYYINNFSLYFHNYHLSSLANYAWINFKTIFLSVYLKNSNAAILKCLKSTLT